MHWLSPVVKFIGCHSLRRLSSGFRIDTVHFVASDVPEEAQQFTDDRDIDLFAVFAVKQHSLMAVAQAFLRFPTDCDRIFGGLAGFAPKVGDSACWKAIRPGAFHQ